MVFWDIEPCSLVEVDRRFRGAYCLCHHGLEAQGSSGRWTLSGPLPGVEPRQSRPVITSDTAAVLTMWCFCCCLCRWVRLSMNCSRHHHHHHWLYSLLQALTAPTMLFRWLHSCALFLHPWIPRTRRSCSTLSCHLVGGLPFFHLPSVLVNVTFLHGSVSLARYRCPNHLSLPAFIILIISLSSCSWYSS
jgi:hypothetical protein